jgi:hypothetical protein
LASMPAMLRRLNRPLVSISCAKQLWPAKDRASLRKKHANPRDRRDQKELQARSVAYLIGALQRRPAPN